MQEQVLLKKPEQFNEFELANEEDRIYRGFGSVEIKDSHGDLLPMKQFMKVMPTIMDRGGLILDSHSNRPIGKIINYAFTTHPETGKEGILLTVKNYKGTNFDDVVWNKIKSGEYTGFSFGGMSITKPKIKFDKDMDVTKIINEFEGFEFSAVEVPANKASTFTEINYLAKGNRKENKSKILLQKTKTLYIKKKLNLLKGDKITKSLNRKGDTEILKMPEDINPNEQNNSVEERISQLEEAVSRILEMLQSDVEAQKSKEVNKEDDDDDKDKKKEEDVSENAKLPKSPAEKETADDDNPESEADTSDEGNMVEKELTEIKKSLSEIEDIKESLAELKELKKMLQDNKTTTPRVNNDRKGIEKSFNRPKNFQEARNIAKELGIRR